MSLKNWKGIVVIAVAAVMTLCAVWNAGATPEWRDFEIEGTWNVTVTQSNCATGAPIGTFKSILTFADGGTMAEDTSNPAFPTPGERGAGQGYWHYKGGRSFYAKSIAFIHPPAGAASPFKAGTQIISQTIQFAPDNPDAWSTTQASVEFLDSTGTLYHPPSPFPVCVSATATRFE
jgi:hypothetical protein